MVLIKIGLRGKTLYLFRSAAAVARIWNIDRSENCKTVANQPGQKEGMQLEWVAMMMIMIIMKIERRFSITYQHKWSTYNSYYYVTTTDRSTLPLSTDQGLKIKQHGSCGAALRSITQECTRRILGQLHSHGDEAGKGLTLFEKLQGFIFHYFLRTGLQHGPTMRIAMHIWIWFYCWWWLFNFPHLWKMQKILPSQHSNIPPQILWKILYAKFKGVPIYGRTKSIIQYDFRKVYRLVYKNSEEN